MSAPLAPTLALAAATIGALHALAPDHWLPIAAVARARSWSVPRTARVALLCGFGHVTVSALLGVIALVSGTAVVEALGARSGAVAGVLLIGFGAAYALWGLRHLAHRHAESRRDASRTTTWTLFAIYCADPCIAIVPIVFAAASLSRLATVVIVIVYELATISTMVVLAALARAGAARVRGHWVEHYGDATAGGLIVATGVLVALLGW